MQKITCSDCGAEFTAETEALAMEASYQHFMEAHHKGSTSDDSSLQKVLAQQSTSMSVDFTDGAETVLLKSRRWLWILIAIPWTLVIGAGGLGILLTQPISLQTVWIPVALFLSIILFLNAAIQTKIVVVSKDFLCIRKGLLWSKIPWTEITHFANGPKFKNIFRIHVYTKRHTSAFWPAADIVSWSLTESARDDLLQQLQLCHKKITGSTSDSESLKQGNAVINKVVESAYNISDRFK